MHSFESDYTAGARVEILRRLNETNLEQLPGYGSDKYCESAKEKIRAACDCPGADIFFMVGGTQTNAVVIDSMLPSYGGVIAAQTGHISDHEAGAIEFTGHKVIALPVYDGKLRAEDVWMYMKDYWQDASHQHFVYPGMVYISYPTEFGTLYTKRELVELASVCRWYNIPLYIDGARLGYGLMSPKCDITLPELAQLCDVFYIGGTKVGALFGEAAVFTKHNMPRYFSTIAKQHGALLAKGRLLGHAVYGRPVFPHQQTRHQHGHADPRRLRCAWPAVLSSFADEPTVPHHGEQGRPCPAAEDCLPHLGQGRRGAQRCPLRHELVHNAGGCRRADRRHQNTVRQKNFGALSGWKALRFLAFLRRLGAAADHFARNADGDLRRGLRQDRQADGQMNRRNDLFGEALLPQ